MKVEELFEGISPIVYHYTRTDLFVDMIKSGEVLMSRARWSDANINDDYKYFLSTTRSRVGDYHRNSRSGVLITLDGRRLAQRFKAAPVNYWNGGGSIADEMEDRIFTNRASISVNELPILKVDILIPSDAGFKDTHMDMLRDLRNERFPMYVYNNRQDWIAGRPQRSTWEIGMGRYHLNFENAMRRTG